MPLAINPRMTSDASLAGPMVQIIFVFGVVIPTMDFLPFNQAFNASSILLE
jgi:hypothetical protein